MSPRTILFHKDHYVCSGGDDSEEDKDVLLVALVVVAAVALVLVLLLSFIIVRERQSKPLFMPLLKEIHAGKTSATQDRL